MKIGIITLFYKNNNYGGVAQAYALNKYFLNLGYDSELICYKKTKIDKSLRSENKRLKGLIFRIINKLKKILKIPIEKVLGKKYEKQLKKREEKLELFRNSIPHSAVYTTDNINEIENKYDFFVTGSDQCWNPGVIDNAYTFSFLDKKDKNIFSYASSIAVTQFSDEYKTFIKKELQKYKNISVREKQSKKILSDITKKEVKLVIDPTLLLDRQEWDKMIDKKRIIKEKYIFSYMLGESTKQRKKIKEIAKKNNLKLVTIPYIKGGNKFGFKIEDYKFGDEQMLDISFNDFLNLIKYADYIITDSFHAVCFSYIFKKEFYVFEKKSLMSTNSRIYNLLDLFGVKDRIISKQINLKKDLLNYETIGNNLLSIIEYSKEYIKESLK